MEVDYINLKWRPDRNERFLGLNAGLATFRRAEGVDGGRLRVEALVAEGLLRERLTTYTPGTLGNAISHQRLWDRCAAGAAPLTVAEDDAAFNKHFARKAGHILAGLPAGWDLILWGWNFDSVLRVALMGGLSQAVMRFDPAPLGARLEEFREGCHDVIPLRLLGAFGLVCYSLSPGGARRLRQACFPLRNETVDVPGLGRRVPHGTLDTLMNRHYPALQAYAAFPPLVWTDNDRFASDVAGP